MDNVKLDESTSQSSNIHNESKSIGTQSNIPIQNDRILRTIPEYDDHSTQKNIDTSSSESNDSIRDSDDEDISTCRQKIIEEDDTIYAKQNDMHHLKRQIKESTRRKNYYHKQEALLIARHIINMQHIIQPSESPHSNYSVMQEDPEDDR